MAIKGELLKEYTKNQLVNCGRVGMYRFGEVLHLTPEQAETIVENNEILYINKHEMHEFGVNRMIYKRDEIRKDKDSLPYCGRFEFFGGDEFITIQEIHKETVKCKLIGPKEIIQKIKDNKELNTVNENMSDDEFAAANADLLNEVKYVKGYFNKPRDEVDTQGLHISKIEDYDNYAYAIYASEKYVYEIRLFRDMKHISRRNKVGLKRAWYTWKFLMIPLIQRKISELEDDVGEYSINNIRINTIIPPSREIELGQGLKMNWLTGVVK